MVGAASRRRARVSALHSPLVKPSWPFRWAPDPVRLQQSAHERESIRAEANQLPPTKWAAVVGSITPRKNLHLVAKAIEKAEDVGLIVAGRISDDAEKLARDSLNSLKASGRLIEMNRELSDSQLDSIIAEADCVVVAHSNEGPSGIVAKAAFCGTPLVLSGAKSLRRDASALGTSAVWCPLTEDSLAVSIEAQVRSIRDEARFRHFGEDLFIDSLCG
ncbi:glycosyltransferase [Microbacterium laevaniformans]|uniref:glycosyltransferase n=1 Tax=Microbacterium laevaniformans TaxID=36807 RepID=UPI00362AB002